MHRGKLYLVDAVGGALSCMAAAIARAIGKADAIAATSVAVADVPPEVRTALQEIGLTPEPVVKLEGDRVADSPEGGSAALGGPGERVPEAESVIFIDASWGARLYVGEGELERLAAARIARDRIERRLQAILPASS